MGYGNRSLGRGVCVGLCVVGAMCSPQAFGQVLNQEATLDSGEGPAHEGMGRVIASDNGIFVVTAGRTAVVYDSATGTKMFNLVPDDAESISVSSLAIDNNLIVVGSSFDSTNGTRSGAAYVFDATTGSQIVKLLPNDSNAFDEFGVSVSISNGIVVIGAHRNNSFTGTAFLFDAITGQQLFKLVASNADFADYFGAAVAISDGIVAVSAPGTSGFRGGTVYLFDAATGLEFDIIRQGDQSGFKQQFGQRLAIDNGLLAVGVPFDDVVGIGSGSVYVFDVATGNQVSKLIPNDGQARDFFGASISIDGGIVVAGAKSDDDLGDQSGSAYIFDANTGVQLSKLLANDGAAAHSFGSAVSIDGGVIVVGARGDNENGVGAGSVHLFDALDGQHIQKIIQSGGAIGDEFGTSIAIYENIVAVGAVEDHDNGAVSGSVYLFDRFTDTRLGKLVPLDGAPSDQFGSSIGIDSEYVAVGAPFDDDLGIASGSAYVFDTATREQVVKLLAHDGAMFDGFGISVASSNGLVAVGAPGDDDLGNGSGSAYVFDAVSGVQLSKLLADDGAANDIFGNVIAIDDGLVVVGASGDGDLGSNSGSAYVFDAMTGVQIVKLLPDDGAALDKFGASVSIFDGVVAVGATGDSDLGANSGSVYVFDAATGTQIFKLLADDGTSGDAFGFSVSISSGVIAVGANGDDDNGIDSGSAYIFDVKTGTQINKLLPFFGRADDLFGQSIAAEGDIVVVGATQTDQIGQNSGSAYVFDYFITACEVDLNRDGELNFFDVSAFLSAFSSGNTSIADLNGDGVLNAFDISVFLGMFASGCP